METINAFFQKNEMCGMSLTPRGYFEYTYPGAGVDTTISGPFLEAMPTKRLTFQDLWGYRKKTPTAANDLDLILPSAISLPLTYWRKNFFIKGSGRIRTIWQGSGTRSWMRPKRLEVIQQMRIYSFIISKADLTAVRIKNFLIHRHKYQIINQCSGHEEPIRRVLVW